MAAVHHLHELDGIGGVLAHGTFDLLHIGHVRYFKEARKYGSLTVTLTADRYVRKEPGRPVFPQEMRAEMIAAIRYVDAVAIVPEATALMAIRTVRPAIYVKGSEYIDVPSDDAVHLEIAEVIRHGGRMIFIERETIYSSSKLLSGEILRAKQIGEKYEGTMPE